MKLIVGLGNPGQRYRTSRHNLGFLVVAELARRLERRRGKRKFGGLLAEEAIEGETLLLFRPEQYMNRSGGPTKQVVDFYQLALVNLLVVVDDLDLPAGRLRLRPRGSSGGHLGLASLIEALGTEEFPRLRVGVGRPPAPEEAAAYVLDTPGVSEAGLLGETAIRAADAVMLWAAEGIEKAMNRLNARFHKPV